MRSIKIILLLFLFICIFFCSQKVFAKESDHVVINEIYPNPNSGENEWIEIYNPTDKMIDLSDYTIEDNVATPKKFSSHTISANGYLVLHQGSGNDFSFTLNNDKDTIILKLNDKIIDQVAYGDYDDGNILDNSSVPDKGESVSRIPNGYDTDIDKDDFKIEELTRGVANISSPIIIYSGEVRVNEIVPKPMDGANNEFVELYNFGSTEIDLSDWKIDDVEAGGSNPYKIADGAIIKPQSYLLFCKKDSTLDNCNYYNLTLSLSDSGDSARLIDPNGDEVYTTLYDKAEKGKSYSFDGSGWVWSEKLTPNQKNEIVVMEEKELIVEVTKSDIRSAKSLEKGSDVKVEGVVTSLPGDISESYFYIQAEGSGVQIYNYYKNFPGLNYGDVVEVTGELSEVSGEKRIKSTSIVVILRGPREIAKEVKLSEVGEDLEGVLVKVVGEVVKPSGDTFYLLSDNVEIKVQIKNKQVKKPKLRAGCKVTVEGIVSEYKGSYRILSFAPESVKITESDQLPRAGASNQVLILYFIPWILFLIAIKRRKNLRRKSPEKSNPVIF